MVRVLLIGMGIAAMVVSFFLGMAMSNSARAMQLARRNGMTRKHRDIYKRSIQVVNQMINSHDLDAQMDPILRQTIMPEGVRTRAQKILDDYREENNA